MLPAFRFKMSGGHSDGRENSGQKAQGRALPEPTEYGGRTAAGRDRKSDGKMEEKTVGKKLKEELCLNPQNMGDVLPQEEIEKAMEFCEGYKAFLNAGKTEREASAYLVGILKEHGYEPFDYTKKYEAGAKVYYHNRNKALIMAVMGTQSIEDGVNIIASHIDSPRLDLKPRPLYEEAQFGMFKTHYYGGIKKYQWTAIPLSLHGVVMTKDGKRVEVSIGEEEGDPVFCVTDLLPHLAADQMKRSLQEGIKGEELNVLVGSLPFKDDEVSERVKLNLIRLLNEKYGMTEADFMTAELEMVPSFPAKDLGLDRSMVGAYGQDDRVCTDRMTVSARTPLLWHLWNARRRSAHWLLFLRIKKKSVQMEIPGLIPLSCVTLLRI